MTTRLFRFIGEGARKHELAMAFVARNYDRVADLASPTDARRAVETRACENL